MLTNNYQLITDKSNTACETCNTEILIFPHKQLLINDFKGKVSLTLNMCRLNWRLYLQF